MSNDIQCKKCGQLKPSTEFYTGKKYKCKSCTYTPKSTFNISVWVEDSPSPTQYTGIVSYDFGELFLRLEDDSDITYIKVSKISKIRIKKNILKDKSENKALIFKSEPTIL